MYVCMYMYVCILFYLAAGRLSDIVDWLGQTLFILKISFFSIACWNEVPRNKCPTLGVEWCCIVLAREARLSSPGLPKVQTCFGCPILSVCNG
jgi:hypothetical protein